ncbi:NTP transferase domain-containing protein [Arhodomonas sp. KWT]|nr:phosphocholine cytidylyltransferase family protein [Arhodomonas sp. KWT]
MMDSLSPSRHGAADAPEAPTHALLLSAGQGRRLLPLTEDRPKCSLSFHGRSVLEWQIDTLLEAGVDGVTVVTGYGAELVEALLERRYGNAGVQTVFNPFYRVSDNLASCWIAREAIRGELLLINGDTLFEGDIVRDVLAAPPAPVTLTVDFKDAYDDDDMKVSLHGDGRLRRVGKRLDPSEVDGESIGMTRFQGDGAALFREAVENAMRDPDALRLWYLSIIDAMADQGHVRAFPIAGRQWAELDFPEDLEPVSEVLAAQLPAASTGTAQGG